jgi:hypothetical protein
MTKALRMESAQLPDKRSRDREKPAEWMVMLMSGRAYVAAAANGLHLSVARRKVRRGSGMHTRYFNLLALQLYFADNIVPYTFKGEGCAQTQTGRQQSTTNNDKYYDHANFSLGSYAVGFFFESNAQRGWQD